MTKRSKAYEAAAKLIDAETIYSPLDAAKLAVQTSPTKFDGTVEVAMRLGVDPRKADQMVRGTVSLPNGTGKTARVIVFATGEQAAAATAAGADKVGSDDLIQEITDGYLDFDAAIATPDQMAKVGRQRHQGRQDHLPRGQAVEPAPHHRQGIVHRRATRGELRRCAGRDPSSQAVLVQGQVPQEGCLRDHHGSRYPS
jgi:ribosomal protein L1